MDLMRLRDTMQKTADALQKAKDDGDLEGVQRNSQYLDRLEAIFPAAMNKAQAAMQVQPPTAPVQQNGNPQATPSLTRDGTPLPSDQSNVAGPFEMMGNKGGVSKRPPTEMTPKEVELEDQRIRAQRLQEYKGLPKGNQSTVGPQGPVGEAGIPGIPGEPVPSTPQNAQLIDVLMNTQQQPQDFRNLPPEKRPQGDPWGELPQLPAPAQAAVMPKMASIPPLTEWPKNIPYEQIPEDPDGFRIPIIPEMPGFPKGVGLEFSMTTDHKPGNTPFTVQLDKKLPAKKVPQAEKTNPIVNDEAPAIPGEEPSAMGGDFNPGQIVTDAAANAADDVEAEALKRIQRELGDKPNAFSLENIILFLLVGAPRTMQKIISEKKEYQSGVRDIYNRLRNERENKANRDKSNAFREREVSATEKNANTNAKYREDMSNQRSDDDVQKAARAILGNPASSPKDKMWALTIVGAPPLPKNE